MKSVQELLAPALAAAILANLLVAWSPHYWPNALGIAGISMVVLAWALSASRVALPREAILAVAIGIWGPLQLLLQTSVLPSLTMRSSLVWMMAAVTFILASQILQAPRSRHIFLRLILWVVTAIAVVAMLQAFNRPIRVFGIFPADPSVVGTMYYKNHFAALMELAAPIALWEVKNGKVMAGGLCYTAMFAATVTSQSRAGTIGILAELVVFLVVTVFGRQLPVKTSLGIVGVLLAVVAGGSVVVGTERIWDRMREPNPYNVREQLARSTFDMIVERPGFGFGMGTWSQLYPRFARFDDARIANEAHNDLAQWAAEGGIPFLLLMAGLVAWLSKRIFQSVWALGLLAVFAHCYVDYALRSPPLQFLWFAIAGAVAQLDARSQRRP